MKGELTGSGVSRKDRGAWPEKLSGNLKVLEQAMSDEANPGHNTELHPVIAIVMTGFFLLWTGMIYFFTNPDASVPHLIWFRF
ncbi:hypothetical protein DYH09_34085 [bacterium CPR1]|nr:hypothetical protein [bacterium CPR1]